MKPIRGFDDTALLIISLLTIRALKYTFKVTLISPELLLGCLKWGSLGVMSPTGDMTHSQMLGKVESYGGPIFKVVLEC